MNAIMDAFSAWGWLLSFPLGLLVLYIMSRRETPPLKTNNTIWLLETIGHVTIAIVTWPFRSRDEPPVWDDTPATVGDPLPSAEAFVETMTPDVAEAARTHWRAKYQRYPFELYQFDTPIAFATPIAFGDDIWEDYLPLAIRCWNCGHPAEHHATYDGGQSTVCWGGAVLADELTGWRCPCAELF